MNREWPHRLGRAVREARRRLGMSQERLGEPLLSKSFISQLEKGAVSPSVESLLHIAGRLGIPAGQLLDWSDPATRADARLALAEAAVVVEGPGGARPWMVPVETGPAPAPALPAREARIDGLIRLFVGEPHDAAERLQHALDLEPSLPEGLITMYWLGAAYQSQGRPMAAARTWEQVATVVPPPPPDPETVPAPRPGLPIVTVLRTAAWARLANLYDAIGDPKEAARARAEAGDGPPAAQGRAGAALARFLWRAAVEAYGAGDLAAAASLSRLAPLLVSGPDIA
ncbi:MAG: helix-turn-helix transcriptional regulator [Firmicutes bacterium]|nr:helix-turn-helix transcriptional regulator [Bacillota bacterium]